MKTEVSPKLFVSIIGVVVLVVAVWAWRVWMAPSSYKVATDDQGKAGPMSAGGIPPEAFKIRDEYNRTHPDAKGSR